MTKPCDYCTTPTQESEGEYLDIPLLETKVFLCDLCKSEVVGKYEADFVRLYLSQHATRTFKKAMREKYQFGDKVFSCILLSGGFWQVKAVTR
jgi:hypothetical protein